MSTDDRKPLRPETALPLLRSSSWHPGTVAACLAHVVDWLQDTRQWDAATRLRSTTVSSPHSADQTTLGALLAGELAAAEATAEDAS